MTAVDSEHSDTSHSVPDTQIVSVVIPITYAEVSLRELVTEYARPFQQAGYQYEIVLVLDGVANQLGNEAAELGQEFPVKIVALHGIGLGEAAALSAGVERAAGELIVNAPQYLQVEPEDAIKVVKSLESGADFVATLRSPRVDPWLNRLQSKVFNWFMSILMGHKFHDLNCGMRGMRRQVLEEVTLYGELYRFLPVLAQRQGFKVVEIKVRHREERGRHGFYGIGVYVRRLLDILAISFLARFTQRPLRFFGMLGLLVIVLGLVLCAEPLWDKLYLNHSLQDRPVFVLGTILIAFGVQLIGFGLVGEIVIFTQARNLGDYQVDEVLQGEGKYQPPAATVQNGFDAGAVAQQEVQVREILPGEDARWDAFVAQHPKGTFFHRSGWGKVVQDTFGHTPHYLVAEKNRQWVGILPLFRVSSPFYGRNLISIPYAVYGGSLSDDPAVTSKLMEAAQVCGKEQKAGYVELRQMHSLQDDLPHSDLYVTYRKELPKDAAEILPGIPKKARAEVRRARDKFKLSFAETDDLQSFYQLFVDNKKRLGSPSLPMRWLRALRTEFGSKVVIHMVKSEEGEPMAAVMSFRHGDTLYAYYSGAIKERQKTGVNNFIYCSIMEWCVQNGFRVFDFGRSRRDTGAASFKKNMGFVAEPLHYEYLMLEEGASLPEFNPSNPKLSMPRKIWSHLPPIVARGLSGPLSRYLP